MPTSLENRHLTPRSTTVVHPISAADKTAGRTASAGFGYMEAEKLECGAAPGHYGPAALAQGDLHRAGLIAKISATGEHLRLSDYAEGNLELTGWQCFPHCDWNPAASQRFDAFAEGGNDALSRLGAGRFSFPLTFCLIRRTNDAET